MNFRCMNRNCAELVSSESKSAGLEGAPQSLSPQTGFERIRSRFGPSAELFRQILINHLA